MSNVLACRLHILQQGKSVRSNEIRYHVQSQGQILSTKFLVSSFSHLRESKLTDLLSSATDVMSNGKILKYTVGSTSRDWNSLQIYNKTKHWKEEIYL